MYKIKTHALLLVLLSFALIGCDPKTPTPETAATDTSVESESDRLNAWLEERYEEEHARQESEQMQAGFVGSEARFGQGKERRA